MVAIERLTGQPVERVVVPGFGGAAAIATKAPAPFKSRGSAGVRSFRPRRASR